MKSLMTKLVKIFFDEDNKHWNTTIFVEFYEDDQENLLEMVRNYYKNMGKVESIEVLDTEISHYVDLTLKYEEDDHAE